jgi:hypothetical protein
VTLRARWANVQVGAVEGLEHARTFAAHRLYFSGMRTLLNHPVQLQQLLLALHQQLTAQADDDSALEWHEGDRQLFVGQFGALSLVQQVRSRRYRVSPTGHRGIRGAEGSDTGSLFKHTLIV